MKLRNLLIVLPLGVLAGVLPAMASSETTPPVVNATGGEYGTSTPVAWSPAQVTIGVGGSVTFANPSTAVPHGIIWTSASKPICSGVPVGEEQFDTHWSGSCTFSQASTYTFECSVHHREMTGTITVTAAGTQTTVTSPQGTTTTTTPTPSGTTPKPTPVPIAVHHLTRAQKLAKALKACKKQRKGKRAACRKRARKRYAPHH